MTDHWQVDRTLVAAASSAVLDLAPLLDGYDLSVTVTIQTIGWDHWKTRGGLEIVPSVAELMFRTKGPTINLGLLDADPRTSFEVKQYATPEKVTYRARLSQLALQRLEEQRDGATIDFELWAYARAFVGGGRDEHGGALVSPGLALRHFGRVGADEWHGMVKAVGATSSIIVEIPIPDSAEYPELGRALVHLRTAIEQRGRGDSPNAVATSRLALDELEHAGFGGHAPREVMTFLQQNARRMSLSERFSMIQAALNVALSPAHHGGANRADLGRFDAQFAVTSVAALLALAPYRGRRPPQIEAERLPDTTNSGDAK